MPKRKIIFVVGPTAVGKSEAAYTLAKSLGGEIVSADAMQVYREVSVASNKPDPKWLEKVPHHLLNIISVQDDFDVAQFNQLALESIRGIHRRGKVPVVVGGSGMYVKVLLDGIFEKGNVRDQKLREELQRLSEHRGGVALHQRLLALDPAAAGKIHPNDVRRLIRAIEVCVMARKPISRLQKTRKGLWGDWDVRYIGLNCDRAELYRKINARVDEMFERGLVDEVKRLMPGPISPSALGMIGIKEVLGYLEGKIDLDRAKYLMKLHTRHFAKRQLTWFRADNRIEWYFMKENDRLKEIANQILKKVKT